MARSDLLLSLIRAGAKGDQAMFRRTAEAIIAEERAKRHDVLAGQLSDELRSAGGKEPSASFLTEFGSELVSEIRPRRRLDELVLSEMVRRACEEVIEEQHRRDLLRSHALEPRHRILLAGPPGNGKTTLAEALAEALAVPLLVVRYESVVGSYLGETAQRLRRLFDSARQKHCLLFFDEFDAIGKERGDEHETGEIKRVVSSLLLQIDALPSHTMIVVASNHPELLDRAVWRRFQVRLELEPPSDAQIKLLLAQVSERCGFKLPVSRALLDSLHGASFAEVEEFVTDVMRRRALRGPDANTRHILAAAMENWAGRFELSKKKPRRRR